MPIVALSKETGQTEQTTKISIGSLFTNELSSSITIMQNAKKAVASLAIAHSPTRQNQHSADNIINLTRVLPSLEEFVT